MKEAKLTADQVRELQPYERNFKQATEAAWCSYPGQAGIAKMQDIWESLTGSRYPYQPGCSNCLLNMVRDLGTIYFAQKDSVLEAEAQTMQAAKSGPEKESEPKSEPEKEPKKESTRGKRAAKK